jgi:Flp pilus assembly protein TadG
VVEFALLAPVLFALLFGILDFGRAVFTYNTITNAAREGARWGIVRDTDGTLVNDVKTQVANYAPVFALTTTVTCGGNASSDCVTTSPGPGDTLTVAVQSDYQPVVFIIGKYTGGVIHLKSTTVMVFQ